MGESDKINVYCTLKTETRSTLSQYSLLSSDIEVARAQTPKDIAELADEIGLLPSEVDMYGKKKAKVSLSVLQRLASQQDGCYVVVAG